MSSDEAMARLHEETNRRTDALVALMEGMAEEQQAALKRMAAQSEKAAQWLYHYLSERGQA